MSRRESPARGIVERPPATRCTECDVALAAAQVNGFVNVGDEYADRNAWDLARFLEENETPRVEGTGGENNLKPVAVNFFYAEHVELTKEEL